MSAPSVRAALATGLAMCAFAGNSLLCRLALRDTQIDAASFTTVRILAGAAALWLIVRRRGGVQTRAGDWRSAFALFAYAAGFSFAYLSLAAGTGALLLFGAVQATMIYHGLRLGERLHARQIAGFACALAGLVGLVFPGVTAPPLQGALLMAGAGVAWGVYSLRGRGVGDPIAVTAGNFMRATAFALALSIALSPWARLDVAGLVYAIASGALTSGVGYAIWYTALKGLPATRAAVVQLSVPALTALGGVALLDERLTYRMLIASIAILGGVALVMAGRASPATR